jgi:heme exporter protein A
VNSPYLQAISLTCERDQRLLFEGLDIAVHKGEMLHVTGVNGSGKSSLLRLLTGLMAPACGEVRLKGNPIKRSENRAHDMLWIGHAAGIAGLLSAEENLAWLGALHQPVSRTQIWQALEIVGLQGFEDVPCHTLSAGQQRRVALARLYLDPPPLLVLDEPFSALDQATVSQLENHLASHCQQGGLIVLTTHHTLGITPPLFRTLELGMTAGE